jgi:hypothetical protein
MFLRSSRLLEPSREGCCIDPFAVPNRLRYISQPHPHDLQQGGDEEKSRLAWPHLGS